MRRSAKNDIDAVREILVDWKDDAVPYSEDALACALDYNVVFHELDRMGLNRAEYDERLEDVRAMESAALAAM